LLPDITGLLCGQGKAHAQENAEHHPSANGIHPSRATANVSDNGRRAARNAGFF